MTPTMRLQMVLLRIERPSPIVRQQKMVWPNVTLVTLREIDLGDGLRM